MSDDNNPLTPPEPMVVQFGHGTKVHFVVWSAETRFDEAKTPYLYANTCGVASRHNVHGMRQHHSLTMDDVDCVECRKRVERFKAQQ